MTDVDWNFQLAEQLDWHWRTQLRFTSTEVVYGVTGTELPEYGVSP
jgi:hypothetical protein